MFILFVQMVSYDATVTGFVPHVSFPCRHTTTIALTNFEQKRSCACSLSTHRTLPYGQDRSLANDAASAACMVATCQPANVSIPCRHTMTIALSNFDQKHSCVASLSTHRTLSYGQDVL
ncbi:hypothetical protein AVEN_50918-1 [Araneus ventricosus]|uniref:Uncharacterized protein n=1 Tax=Araneus ventricosus TaxID=182803 RepID=A0A4Y2DWR6_ARAVE|nr:hypothetical protein AVEN_50918-1 [Araneus ventricosus]